MTGFASTETLDAALAAADWPNRRSSRAVVAGGLNWHVQIMGTGPACLLLHGTGASTHSWRDVAPALARHLTVVVPDLPGHGFTDAPKPEDMTLPGMSRLVRSLLEALEQDPQLAVGHSAGAAILTRMSLDRPGKLKLIIGVNGAMLPFGGPLRFLYPALARMMLLNSVTRHVLARRARSEKAVADLISGTGSSIDERGLAGYAVLFRDPEHVGATLRMMAQWDLQNLNADFPKLMSELVLIATGADRAVPADQAFKVKQLVPRGKVIYLRDLGHLAHEERPQMIADLILQEARSRSFL
jgi:magnesium chelatase accessory protein